MFQNLTYRQKFKYMIIGSILMIILCYQFSISKTIQQYKIYKQYNLNNLSNSSDEVSLQMLHARNANLDKILSRFVLDTLDESKNVLGVIGRFCAENELKLKEYMPGLPIRSDSITTLTRNATVEGSFINCLNLLYHLEVQSNVGKVGSVHFKSYSSPGSDKVALNCTIFIQNIIPESDEKK